jgi:hypothetical protein
MNNHLIIGYGKWSKKNLAYLEKKKFFDKIIIKRRDKYFFYSKKRKLNKQKFNEILESIKSVHICSPIKTHFTYLKRFNFFEKTIVEKPFVEKLSQLKAIKNIYKNKYFLVNYIDTFNPLIPKIKKSLDKKKFNQIILNYSKKDKFYKNKHDFALEWLDHPLSLVLLFFKKFPKMQIKSHQIIKKNNHYNQKIIINYNFKSFNLIIKLNCSLKIERNLQIIDKDNIQTFHFYKNSIYKNNKKTYMTKKNSFDNFYNSLLKKQKNPNQNFDFHKKIILERNKILKSLKKTKL